MTLFGGFLLLLGTGFGCGADKIVGLGTGFRCVLFCL